MDAAEPVQLLSARAGWWESADGSAQSNSASTGNHRAAVVHHGIQGAESTALVFQFSVDNSGAPSADFVETFWKTLQTSYRNAKIQASSIDAFAAELLA